MRKIALLAMVVILVALLAGCAKGDETPPVISDVSASNITETGATITWTTDEPATSQVEYGLTTGYSSSTLLDATLVTSHSVSLSGLDAGTEYHYRVKSEDASENEAVSADATFTTSIFPDENLEAAVREAIGKPEGPIYLSDLEGLTSLDASERDITDLTGLEYCTSLTWLDLSHNQISDLSPLSELTSLAYLHLEGNQIGDLSPLSGLTSLTVLSLSNTQTSDLSLLSGLTSLTELNLGGNQISDLSPLSGLTSLTELNLSGNNQISDLSPLSGLTSLAELYLWSNQISDLSPLSRLTSLTWLGLGDNQISNVSALSGLTSLTGLDLSYNQISDVSPLSGLTSLTELYLNNNQIADITPLVDNSGLGEGDTIDLRGNPLSAESLSTLIPQLEARGVEVLYDAG
jgi:Leucine-rich repeat (LRR) protein